jgi:hypothetical protein
MATWMTLLTRPLCVYVFALLYLAWLGFDVLAANERRAQYHRQILSGKQFGSARAMDWGSKVASSGKGAGPRVRAGGMDRGRQRQSDREALSR